MSNYPQDHSGTPDRYHSIDIRPSIDSETSPPHHNHLTTTHDPYSSQTNLPMAHAPMAGGPSYPPDRHARFPTPKPVATIPLSDIDLTGGKTDEKGDGKTRPNMSRRSSSWDLLGFKGGEWADYDSRNASEAHLQFAEGDFAKTRVARFYAYLLNLSIVSRWFLYIVPMAGILWIPGILGLTVYPYGNIWHVRLIWWSIWFTIIWVGWWAALAFGMILPKILRWTIGVAAVASRLYIDWLNALHRYIALFAWSLAVWVSFQPLIDNNLASEDAEKYPGSSGALDLIAKIGFGVMLCSAVLLAEKFAIQWIAYKFHQRSYAERIMEQKVQIKCLTILYVHSSDIPGRNDTLKDTNEKGGIPVNPKKLLRNVLKGVRGVAEGATTVFGNVASEIVGSSTLQPNSPEAKVNTALASANKTRLLARRLFYSFVKPGATSLLQDDIAKFFPNPDQAHIAFHMFDKDGNGDASREEVELACLEVHRERLTLAASMKDIDSAVGRLDNILMSLHVLVAALIMAVSLNASFSSLLTGAGTLILGLSWLIGASASEVLSSIIFLFIKHPYDISDTVIIDSETYTVKEIRLLSTIFIDSKGCYVQAPHSELNTHFIRNHRRSGAESEPFEFDVAFDTSFEHIEELRSKMLAFVESRRRDFLPIFDLTVQDIPEQTKMVLRAEIKYKSNNHLGALKAKRRNMWICALKNALKDTRIFGPDGDPDAPSGPQKYTLVPWETVEPGSQPTPSGTIKEPIIPRDDYNFSDKNAAILDAAGDVFGESADLHLTDPRRTAPRGTIPMPTAQGGPAGPSGIVRQRRGTGAGMPEAYEMKANPPPRSGPEPY